MRNLREKAVTSVLWKFSERIIAQLVSLVINIILARLLLPEDYSVISLCTIFFAVADIFINGGLNTALIQKKEATIEDYSTVLSVSVFISIMAYVSLFFASPYIANYYSQPVLVPVIRVMSIILIVNAYKSVICAYISVKLDFKKFFIGTIFGTVISAVVGIIMAYNGLGVWALVAQQMTNTVIDTILLTLLTRVRIGFKFYRTRFKGLFGYSWKLLASSIVQTIYSYLIPLVIGKKYTPSDLSFYTKGRNFPDLVLSSTSSTFSAVLFPVMAKFQEDKTALLRNTRRFISLCSYVLFPIMLGMFAVSDNMVTVLLTDKWAVAAEYVKIFCIANMFEMVHVGNCETIKAMGRSDIYLVMEIIKKTSYFITITLFIIFGRTPVQLACAFIVCTVIALIVNIIPNISLIGYKIKMQLEDILPNLIMALIMCGAVLLINKIDFNIYLKLLIQIILGTALYIFESIITRNRNFYFLLDIAKSYIAPVKRKDIE